MNHVRVLRRSGVTAMTSLSRPTIYRLMKRGEFPQQMRLSANAVGWDIRDVLNWIDERRIACSGSGK